MKTSPRSSLMTLGICLFAAYSLFAQTAASEPSIALGKQQLLQSKANALEKAA